MDDTTFFVSLFVLVSTFYAHSFYFVNCSPYCNYKSNFILIYLDNLKSLVQQYEPGTEWLIHGPCLEEVLGQLSSLQASPWAKMNCRKSLHSLKWLCSAIPKNEQLRLYFLFQKQFLMAPLSLKVSVHILGKICPRSNPDIAHMEYSMEPLKFIVYQGAYDSGSLEFSHVKSPQASL